MLELEAPELLVPEVLIQEVLKLLELVVVVLLEVLEVLELLVVEVLELVVLKLLELVVLLLEVLGLLVPKVLTLEVLELRELVVVLLLEVLEVLELLVPEVLVLVVLELLELVVLLVPEVLDVLEVLEVLEALELESLELEALELEALELEALELEVLALGVLELSVLVLEALCSGDYFSFRHRHCLCRHLARHFASRNHIYSQTPHCLLLLHTLSSQTPLQSVVSLRLVLPLVFALVRTGRRAPRHRPPPVAGTHHMALHPSSVPQLVPLPSPPASSLADGPDPTSYLLRAARPTVPRLLATVVTDPSFESTSGSAIVVELVDFAAAYRLDYAASLVAESESVCPPSVGGECALGTNVLEDRQEDFEYLEAAVPHLVYMLLAPEGDLDAPDIPTPRSYAEAITGPYSS
ncbi:unnamed protein product [Closterium sp. NIES-65]|nr:unnamed protein product [Closterium sp. NIES-65]